MTAIICFILTSITIVWSAKLFNNRNIVMAIIYVMKHVVMTFIIVLLLAIFFIPNLDTVIIKQINAQYNVFFNYTPESSYFFGWIPVLLEFENIFSNYYPALIFGSGFATFGIVGGDYGFVETLFRFGPIIYVILIIMFIIFTRKSIKLYKYTKNKLLLFPAILIIYFLISEVHYTVWSTKSTLPIVFFSFTLLRLKLTPSQGKFLL